MNNLGAFNPNNGKDGIYAKHNLDSMQKEAERLMVEWNRRSK